MEQLEIVKIKKKGKYLCKGDLLPQVGIRTSLTFCLIFWAPQFALQTKQVHLNLPIWLNSGWIAQAIHSDFLIFW